MENSQLRSDVIKRISQDNWLSDDRRKYLERLATLTAGSKIRVRFESMPTASCEWRDAGGYHVIRMRNKKVSTAYLGEIESKLGSSVIHTLMQEGFLYHELGHVLMSDYDAWGDVVDSYSSSLIVQAMFKQWLNCTEDVVIEAWLREKYGCGKILDFKNEVKFHCLSNVPRTKKASYDYYDEFYARQDSGELEFALGLIESLGRFDGHFIEWAEKNRPDLMEKFRPQIQEMISESVREPNARARYEIILDTFSDLISNFRGEDTAEDQDQENPSGGSQQMQTEMIPVPDGQEGEDQEKEQEQDEGSGEQPVRDPRDPHEILQGRDPESVKVVK